MLLPTQILPSALGIHWKQTTKEVLQVLITDTSRLMAPLPKHRDYCDVEINIEGEKYTLELFFERDKGLFRTQVELFTSKYFFDNDHDEVEKVQAEYDAYYYNLVNQLSLILGSPAFSGSKYLSTGDPYNPFEYQLNPEYPENQWAWKLTCWSHPEGRLQLELDQEDKELPFIITIACTLNDSRQ